MVFIWAVLTCVAVLSPHPASAQALSLVPDKLALAEALRIATERNPLLGAARLGVDVAEANRFDLSRRPNPALTMESEGYPIFSGSRPGFTNGQATTVRVDQELELRGRRRLRTQAGDIGIEVARAAVLNQQRQLDLDVRRAYFQLVLAQADSVVARASLEEIDKVLGLNRARFEQGEISGTDVRRLQVERLKFVDDVFGADLALRNARSALLALLNAPDLAQPIEAIEPLDARPAGAAQAPAATLLAAQPPTVTARPAMDASAMLARALAGRPDLLAMRAETRRADTETRLQRALRTPNLTIGGGYFRDLGTNAVVFSATVPLAVNNRNQGAIARAEAEQRIAEIRATASETVVRLDVQQAVNAVDVNRSRVEYIEREYLGPARDSRDAVLASYRLGATDLIDYLDAQRAFRDTLRTYNRALYEQRLSLFQLEAAVGASPTVSP